MFKRQHHQYIEQVLRSLNAETLQKYHCFFGGGTAIVLKFGEYRESVDLDFVISDIASYRSLRQIIAESGIAAIFLENSLINPLQDVRADQYGIRTQLSVLEKRIKFEIVFEARVDLAKSNPINNICGVPTLTTVDMIATKLLANSDRWADAGVFNRDLIDLAMMEFKPADWDKGLKKAQSAYGEAILADLQKSLEAVMHRENWLERCMQALSIKIPKALLFDRMNKIKKMTER